MSILSAVETIEQSVVDEATALAGNLEQWIVSEAQKVIAAAANTNFGTVILNLMSAAQNTSMTGAQKLAAVIEAGIKAATEFLSIGGWSGVFAAVKDFIAGMVQMLYPDFIKAFAPKAA